MRRRPARYRMLGVAIGLLAVASPCLSEVSVERSQDGFLVGILEAHWPEGSGWPGLWSPVRQHIPQSQVLNPDGELRGDGPPSFLVNSESGRPEVVWAYWDGTDYEIAHAEWLGSAWSAIQLLTDNGNDDLAPSLVELVSGGLGVAWWRDGATPDVLYLERLAPAAPFGPETPVSGGVDPARAPSVARESETVLVGYESDAPSLTAVIVESRQGQGSFAPEVIASTTRTDDLEVRVSEDRGRVWAAWIDSDTHLGWSERTQSGWTSPSYEQYEGPDDLGRARLEVKKQVVR